MSSPRALPPGPAGHLGVGSLFEAWKNPLELMCRGMATYGPVAQYKFGWMRYVAIAEPGAAHHVLVENARNYVKSQNYQGLKVVLGEGLLTSEGDFWRKQRKMMQPAFHRERIAAFVDEMVRCTREAVERWGRAGGEHFDLHKEMMRLTFRVVGRTLLSVDLDGDAREVGEALDVALHWADAYVESLVKVPPWFPTPNNMRFQRAQKTLSRLVRRIVDGRREGLARGDAPSPDLLQMLLETRDESTGEAMSDEQIEHELLTMILAGHETTANALTFAFWMLSEHHEARERLEREVSTVLGRRDPTLADVARLPWTTQVIEETMRLYPPAWVFERQALADDTVAGYFVPKGTVVGIAPYIMHRNPQLFPEPETFSPERFDRAAAKERAKHAYLPFGGGPRTCIGNAFAMTEMVVMCAMIARDLRFERVAGFQLELEPAVTLRPRHGMPMRVTRAVVGDR